MASHPATVVTVRRLYETGEARRIRRDARYSLREAAALAGVPFGSLARYERGEQRPGPQMCERLVCVLSTLMQAQAEVGL